MQRRTLIKCRGLGLKSDGRISMELGRQVGRQGSMDRLLHTGSRLIGKHTGAISR